MTQHSVPIGNRDQECARPMTGDEYLRSLNDGRAVFIYGEQVGDVTRHPAFRQTARSIARLYESLHDPAQRSTLTTDTDTGNGSFTHAFFRAPRSVAELRSGRDAITGWARQTFGWLGRSPDYKAAFLTTMGMTPDFYQPFGANACRWYRQAQEQVLFFSHALVDPPVDRHLPPEQVKDICVRVDEETDSGIVVSGAKVVATGAALTHQVFIAPIRPSRSDPDLAVVFIAALNNPGVNLICRASYELAASRAGSPFDYPLSSRFDENDAIIVFDRALIPWEDVLIYRDVDRVGAFLGHSGFRDRFLLHGATRLGVKLDFLCGLLLRASRITGSDAHRGVAIATGEALAWRHTVHALGAAMVDESVSWAEHWVAPNPQYALGYRALAPTAYSRVKQIIQAAVGSSLIYLNSHASDFAHPRIRGYLDTYLRGTGDVSSDQRVKVMKLLWDSIGTEFAGRHELYEQLYAGHPDSARIETVEHAHSSGLADELDLLIEECMTDYDLAGWVPPDR